MSSVSPCFLVEDMLLAYSVVPGQGVPSHKDNNTNVMRSTLPGARDPSQKSQITLTIRQDDHCIGMKMAVIPSLSERAGVCRRYVLGVGVVEEISFGQSKTSYRPSALARSRK